MFVNNFVIKSKRERYLFFLNSKKNRKKFTNALSHFKDLDESLMVHPYDGNDITYELISKYNPNEMCYVISENKDYDGKEVPLKEAISNLCEPYVSASIISCIPGKLIIHQDEDMEGAAIYLKNQTT